MDNSGKIIWSKNHEIQLTKTMKLKSLKTITDGEPLPITSDDRFR